jgi:hypothetical protein
MHPEILYGILAKARIGGAVAQWDERGNAVDSCELA